MVRRADNNGDILGKILTSANKVLDITLLNKEIKGKQVSLAPRRTGHSAEAILHLSCLKIAVIMRSDAPA